MASGNMVGKGNTHNDLSMKLCQDSANGLQTPKRSKRPNPDLTPRRVLKSLQSNTNLYDGAMLGSSRPNPNLTPRRVLKSLQSNINIPDEAVLGSSRPNPNLTPGRVLKSLHSNMNEAELACNRPNPNLTPRRVLKSLHFNMNISDEAEQASNRPNPNLTPRRVLKSKQISISDETRRCGDVFTPQRFTKSNSVSDNGGTVSKCHTPNFTPKHSLKSQLSGMTGPGRPILKTFDLTPKRVLKSKQVETTAAGETMTDENSPIITPRHVLKSQQSDVTLGPKKDLFALTPQHVLKSQGSSSNGPDCTLLNQGASLLTPQRSVKFKQLGASGPRQTPSKQFNKDSPSLTPRRVPKSQQSNTDGSNDVIPSEDSTLFTPQQFPKSKLSGISGHSQTVDNNDSPLFVSKHALEQLNNACQDMHTPQHVLKLSGVYKDGRAFDKGNTLTPQRVVKERLSDIPGPSRLIRNNDAVIHTPQRCLKSPLSGVTGHPIKKTIDLTPRRVVKSWLSDIQGPDQLISYNNRQAITQHALKPDTCMSADNTIQTSRNTGGVYKHDDLKSNMLEDADVSQTSRNTDGVYKHENIIDIHVPFPVIHKYSPQGSFIKSELFNMYSTSDNCYNSDVLRQQNHLNVIEQLPNACGSQNIHSSVDVSPQSVDVSPQSVVKLEQFNDTDAFGVLTMHHGTRVLTPHRGHDVLTPHRGTDVLTPHRGTDVHVLTPHRGQSQPKPDDEAQLWGSPSLSKRRKLQECKMDDNQVERSRIQGKLTGCKIEGYRDDGFIEGCRGDECNSNSDDLWRDRLEAKVLTESSTQSVVYRGNRPEMQLPVVLSPVEKSDGVPDMPPNTASTNWIKAESGTPIGESITYSTERAESICLIGPKASCDMSTANQNLLDHIQQRLERKFQETGGPKPKDTNLLIKGSADTTDNYLNNNNNVVVDEDTCTYEPVQTAGQSNRNFSQGFLNDTNANNITSFDFYPNLGNVNVTTSSSLEGPTSGVTGHMKGQGHTLETNLTYDTSHVQDSSLKQSGKISKPHLEMPFNLRNLDMSDTVVSPNNDIYEVNFKTHAVYGQWNAKTVESQGCKSEEQIAPNDGKETKLYAPTPIIKRQAGPQFSTKGHDANTNIPLMTPLALKMVAKQQQASPRFIEEQTQATVDSDTFETETKQEPQMEDMSDISLEDPGQAAAYYEDWSQDELQKTPPPKKSAFYVVRKSSLSPLVGSMSLRGNTIGKAKRSKITARSKDRGHKQMYMSMHERYYDALLDEEVTRFASRLVAEHTGGYLPRICNNPVAKILMEGDDMHFVPIEDMQMNVDCTSNIPGSAFTKYSLWAD